MTARERVEKALAGYQAAIQKSPFMEGVLEGWLSMATKLEAITFSPAVDRGTARFAAEGLLAAFEKLEALL